MADGRFDDLLLGLASKHKNVEELSHSILSFFERRTDLFHVMESPNERMGFMPGTAEKMFFKHFHFFQSRYWDRAQPQLLAEIAAKRRAAADQSGEPASGNPSSSSGPETGTPAAASSASSSADAAAAESASSTAEAAPAASAAAAAPAAPALAAPSPGAEASASEQDAAVLPENRGAMAPVDPFYKQPVPVLSHHPDPFWGPPTSTVDWCEPNYVHTRYVAEVFNTLSSVPMLLVGLHGIWLARYYDLELRVYLCWAGIATVGVGTMLFHGTLQFAGQAADELPMIYASLVFTYAAVEVNQPAPRWRWLPFLEAIYALGFTVAYFTSPFFFPFFVAAYATTVLLIIIRGYRVYLTYKESPGKAGRWQRSLFWVAATFYPGGFLLLWLPENLLCPAHPRLFSFLNLHAIFHLVTTTSPFCFVVFMTYHRCVVLHRPAEHRVGHGLPYVHVLKAAP